MHDNTSQKHQIVEPSRPQSDVSVCTKERQKNTEVGWLPIVMNDNQKFTTKIENFDKPKDCPYWTETVLEFTMR